MGKAQVGRTVRKAQGPSRTDWNTDKVREYCYPSLVAQLIVLVQLEKYLTLTTADEQPPPEFAMTATVVAIATIETTDSPD